MSWLGNVGRSGFNKMLKPITQAYRSGSSAAGAGPRHLDGKVAIVTASTDGIGLAIAKRLAEDGAKVMVSSRKRSNVDATVERLKSLGLAVEGTRCHVGHPEHRKNLIAETMEKFGGIDIFISNAAINPVFGPILQCPEDSWDKIFDVNVKAAFLLTKEIVPIMEKRGGGSIVFVSSIAAYDAIPMLGPYSVSKTALLGLTKALAKELGSSNIRVNAIAPGIIQTKFSSALTENEELQQKFLESTALHRIGTPTEMGGLVSFLCSQDASYITGETFVAAGGMTSKL